MAEPATSIAPLHSLEGRLCDRTHMFVAATLSWDAGSSPIHIRNMSQTGALIEGASVPALETVVTLRRGSLKVSAKIVWLAGRKAGVAFLEAINVPDWMSRTPPTHQARVDEMVRAVRGQGSDQAPAGASLSVSPAPSLLAELRALKAELSQLEKGLCSDMAVVAAHPEIQLIDLALQRVDRLLAGQAGD
jgi:hypothetical protein